MDAFTGLRRNEILGLQIQDIDWFNREVSITKAVSKHPAQDGVHKWEWVIGPPKSSKSVRRVALPETVLQMLSARRQTRPGEEAFIFSNSDTGFLDPDYFNAYVFSPVAKRAEIAEVQFHDLRHFFASMLIAQGEPEVYLRSTRPLERSGHLRYLRSSFSAGQRRGGCQVPESHARRGKKAFGSSLVAKPGETLNHKTHKERTN